MIVALLTDPILRASVRRAARADEDVFCEERAVLHAVRFGFPRLLVYAPEDLPTSLEIDRLARGIPRLALTNSIVHAWEAARRSSGLAVSRVDSSAQRLRGLIQDAAGPIHWVDEVLQGLGGVVGGPLPGAFRGLARRVLELPVAYSDLYALSDLTQVSPGALKARFRRRGLASPSVYLRWLRALAAGQLLSEEGATTLSASYRLGISSDGNFCRWLRSTTGLTPTNLRAPGGMTRLLVAFGREYLDARACEAWDSLDEVFLRKVG